SGDTLKKKWKNLRDCYAKHLRSEVVTHTGQERKILDRYKTWPWAKQMEIFKPFCNLLVQILITNTSQRNSTTRKRRLEEQTQTPTSIDKVIAYFDKKPCNNTQAGYDDVDLIFLSYAKTLKKFSPRRQTMTKFKIAQLLMEEELNQQAED
ncbi:unnamed protein product, partial [Tenebrio molitor]